MKWLLGLCVAVAGCDRPPDDTAQRLVEEAEQVRAEYAAKANALLGTTFKSLDAAKRALDGGELDACMTHMKDAVSGWRGLLRLRSYVDLAEMDEAFAWIESDPRYVLHLAHNAAHHSDTWAFLDKIELFEFRDHPWPEAFYARRFSETRPARFHTETDLRGDHPYVPESIRDGLVILQRSLDSVVHANHPSFSSMSAAERTQMSERAEQLTKHFQSPIDRVEAFVHRQACQGEAPSPQEVTDRLKQDVLKSAPFQDAPVQSAIDTATTSQFRCGAIRQPLVVDRSYSRHCWATTCIQETTDGTQYLYRVSYAPNLDNTTRHREPFWSAYVPHPKLPKRWASAAK